MAINPETQYPGKINPSDADYPYGSARNISTPGDGTGTPWEAAIVNDIIGLLQAILTDASIVPSGSPDTVLVTQYLDGLKQLLINSPRPGVQTEAISCIPRCIAGVFQLLDDANHAPAGFASISQTDAYNIRITYDTTYGEINSLSITLDDALAPYGVTTGGDVGTGFTNFKGYAQLTGLLTKTTFTPHALIDPSDVTVTYVNDVLKITHDAAVTNDMPVVVPSFNVGETPRISVGFSATEITVHAVTDLAGIVRWNGSAFEFWSGLPTFISSSQGGISFAEASGVLTVTHPAATGYDIQATTFGVGSYDVKIDNVSLTAFDVRFYDTDTGAQITTADTDMQVTIKRKVDLLGIIPDNAQFLVRGPRIPIKSANFSNVAGNNFWVQGLMEKA